MKDQRGSITHGGSDADDPFAELVRIVEQPSFRAVVQTSGEGHSEPFSGEGRRGRQEPSFSNPAVSAEIAELEEFEDALDVELRSSAVERSDRRVGLRHGSAKPAPDEDDGEGVGIEATLRGLSRPARPRDHVPVTQSFAPERQHEHVVAPPTTITLDDFDELIASELAAMRIAPEKPSAAQVSLEPSFLEAEDDIYADNDASVEPQFAPQIRRRRSPFRAALLLASVAAIGAAGYVGYDQWRVASPQLGLGGASEPLLIKADMRPFKIPPVDPGGKPIPNQNKAVYEKIGNNQPLPPPVQQKLVSAEEEPMEISFDEGEPVDQLPGVSLMREPIVLNDGETAQATAAIAARPAPESEAEHLEPRRVRTLVVRPDGTLVAQDEIVDPAAASKPASQPVQTASIDPARPEPVRGGTVDPVAGIAPAMPYSVEPTSAANAPAEPAAEAASEPAIPAEVPAVEADARGPVNSATLADVAAVADAPAPASERQEPQVVASIEPQPAEALDAAAALPAGSYYVQISSQPSEGAAKQSMAKLSSRFAAAIGGRPVGIQSAAIAGKGTYYRVRIAAASKAEANKVCAGVQSAGGSCFVTR